jgi:putative ABC transport system permease protein
MQILRTITRRPSRSILTALGIGIGIFALVVVGGLAERVNLIVSGGVNYYGSRILVQDKANDGNFFRLTQPINLDRLQAIRQVPGVSSAFPEIVTLYRDVQGSDGSFGPPPFIIGRDPLANALDPQKLRILAGRDLLEGERGAVVLGEDLQKQTGDKLGDQILVGGSTFTVVGVYEKNFTINDTSAIVPLADAQLLYKPIVSATANTVEQANPATLASQISVFFAEGTDAAALTTAINAQVDGVKALDPESFRRQVENQTRLFNTVVFGAALIALLIGSLSVINTMVMAVAERTREIGIRKAVGASDGRILRDFILEAGVIGLLGGLIGIFINVRTSANGSALFQVTPRLLVGAYGFSVILAMLAGLFPAIKASRLLPIDALNRER